MKLTWLLSRWEDFEGSLGKYDYRRFYNRIIELNLENYLFLISLCNFLKPEFCPDIF